MKADPAIAGVMSKSEYARHRGVVPSMITKLAQAGRIALTDSGKVDVAASDAMLKGSDDNARGGRRAPRQHHEGPERPIESRPAVIESATSLATAQDRRMAAQLKELRLRREAGELCEVAKVASGIESAFTTLREGLARAVPDLAARLAGEPDIRKCITVLEGEVDRLLDELARTIEAQADQRMATSQ